MTICHHSIFNEENSKESLTVNHIVRNGIEQTNGDIAHNQFSSVPLMEDREHDENTTTNRSEFDGDDQNIPEKQDEKKDVNGSCYEELNVGG